MYFSHAMYMPAGIKSNKTLVLAYEPINRQSSSTSGDFKNNDSPLDHP